MITIKHRFTGSILFELETTTIRLALEAAVKGRANLYGADLYGANLYGANLYGADLRGANLYGANLYGAKIRDDITITKSPIQVSGLYWIITIWEQHMQIGCEFHSHAEWSAADDAVIVAMGGRTALKFWREHKAALMALCASHAATIKTEDAA